MKYLFLTLAAGLACPVAALAQTAPDSAAVENFDAFGDASAGGTAYNTQKVLYLTPAKLITVAYEAQLGYHLSSVGPLPVATPATLPAPAETHIDAARGIRLAFNAPVISRNNFLLNLGLTYWNTGLRLANPERSPYFGQLADGLRTTGFNATVFKPFDSKHFLLLQANADASGNYRKPGDVSGKNLTFSGTAVFGWKLNDNLQWGLGLSRTYRAGQLLYIPVLLYNRTFSPQWGCEVVFPARAELRRNFGTTALLKLGYELEGNTYYLGQVGTDDVYLRRGELKPRLTFERRLTGFVWIGAQAGFRYNYRNDAFRDQNPTGKKESLLGSEPSLYQNKLTNPLYFNLSLNLVSP